MKKWVGISIGLFVIAGIGVFLFYPRSKRGPFYLEERYYESASSIELDFSTLQTLQQEEESFGVFIYQPGCSVSAEFEKILLEFQTTNRITFYQMPFSSLKGTNLEKKIKYYPSFLIYQDGKIVDYLEANKNEDMAIYESIDAFQSWFTKYVRLKEVNQDTYEPPIIEKKNMLRDVELEGATYDPNKVNIYLFWGDGCPHCEEEMAFLKKIQKEYGQYFQLYTYETWYDEENEDLMQRFATTMGDSTRGVPYTIIGNQSFKGFNKDRELDFINAIINQHQNSEDIYFDSRNKED